MEEKVSVVFDLGYFMLDVIIIYRVMQYMLKCKYKRCSKWGYIALLYCVFLAKYLTGYLPTDYTDIPLVETMISVGVYIGIFLLTFIFYKGKISEKIFSVSAYFAIASMTELFLIIISMVFFSLSQKEIMENNRIFLLELGFSKILQIISVEMIGNIKNKRKKIIQIRMTFEIGCILIYNLMAFITVVIITRCNTISVKNTQKCIDIIFFAFFISSLVFVIVIIKLMKRRNEEEELRNRIQEMELEKKYNDKIEEMEQQLRSLRHDMNNHMNVIKGLLHLKEYNTLNQYFSDLNQDLEKANQVLVLENKALAVLLTEKVKRAEEAGILLDLEVSEENNNISAIELCSMVGNVLDNAIEATEKVKKDKCIQFVYIVDEKTTKIICENPYCELPIEENGKFFTGKKDKENHGWGTKKIREIVEKYHGELKIWYDVCFHVHIIIPHDNKAEQLGSFQQNWNVCERLHEYSHNG